MSVGPQQVAELDMMTIRDVFFDKLYTSYLVLYLSDGLSNKCALLFDRPALPSETTSKLIGHLIHKFTAVETLLHLERRLIVIMKK